MHKWLKLLTTYPCYNETSTHAWGVFSKIIKQAALHTNLDQARKSLGLLHRTELELCIHYDVILDIEHRYLAFRFARIIANTTPKATHSQRVHIFRNLFKVLRKLHGKQQTTFNLAQGMVFDPKDEEYGKELVNFRDQVSSSIVSWRIKAPTPTRLALEADFAKLPPILTGYLSSLDSLPDELLNPHVAWEDLPETTELGCDAIHAKVRSHHNHILALHDYSHKLLYRLKSPFFRAQKEMGDSVDACELHYCLYHLWGQHYWGSLLEGLSSITKESPLYDIKDYVIQLHASQAALIPLLQYRPFWQSWLLVQLDANPAVFAQTAADCIRDWPRLKSKGVIQWGQLRFPVHDVHLPRMQALFDEASQATDTAHILEIWTYIFEELMCQSNHMDILVSRPKYRKAKNHVYQHYLILCQNFPDVLLNLTSTFEGRVTPWEEYEIEHEIAQEAKQLRASRDKCNQENAEALSQWHDNNTSTEEPAELDNSPLPANSLGIHLSYCDTRSLNPSATFTLQPDAVIPAAWGAFLASVNCPKAMDASSLWNAICFYNNLNDHDLAMLPYDDEQDRTRWKKIKRGSLRLFFHTSDHTTFIHVMQRRDWNHVA
jgi:hypothetical protein